MKLRVKHIFPLAIVLFTLGLFSCEDDSKPGIYPPDYVDPDSIIEDTTVVDTTIVDTVVSIYEKYIYPQVDSNGRIVVAGRPTQYTDTAKYHVVSVGYDIANSTSLDLENYYANAIGKSGDELKEAIAAIITNGFSGQTYGQARYILQETDVDPLNSANVWCFYKDSSVTGTWDAGVTWQREHVWAQSKGAGDASNSVANSASDLNNLKPETPATNGEKGNRDFTEDDSDSTYIGAVGSAGFAPSLSSRGDVARILMYMEVRWGDENGLALDNGVSLSGDARQGQLEVLLQWHNEDPVDPYEIRRNNVIYQYQNNRNPFIDHPELVEYIWGDHQDEAWEGGVVFSNN